MEAFVAKEGMPAARRLLSDLGLTAVSSGGVVGLAQPLPGRAKALEDLKRIGEMMAALGVDRMVCPCHATGKFTADDYRKGVDNLREAGEIVKPFGIVAMLEFMSGSSFIGTLPTALRMTRDAAHSHVKPMFDCYHFWAGLSKFEDLDLIRAEKSITSIFRTRPIFHARCWTTPHESCPARASRRWCAFCKS